MGKRQLKIPIGKSLITSLGTYCLPTLPVATF